MSTDPLTFLDQAAAPAATAPAPDTPAPPPEPLTAEPATELPATTDATPPAPPPAPAAPPVTPPQDTPRVPLPELLNEREKRQAAEARARQVEEANQLLIRQWQQMQQQAQQPPPDIFQNPDAYVQQHVFEPVQRRMAAMNAAFSERIAAMQYGAETVKEALAALHTHPQGPQVAQALDADPDPYGKLVEWHKRESTLRQIGDDLDGFVMRRYQELAAKQAQAQGLAPAGAPMTPQPYARPAVPPPSLASMPAAPAAIQPGHTAALGPGDRFAHVFKR